MHAASFCFATQFLCFLDCSIVSEELKENAHGLILSGIEIHASITDYVHSLASFGADI